MACRYSLGPRHIVLDGVDSAPPFPKGAEPPVFGPYLLWPNGWMDQDATWYGGRSQPRRLCVRWEPSSPPQKGGVAPSPIFDPCPLWPNGWMDQDGTWNRGGPWSRLHCARLGPSSLSEQELSYRRESRPLHCFLTRRHRFRKIPIPTFEIRRSRRNTEM